MSLCVYRWQVRVSSKVRRWGYQNACIENIDSGRRVTRRAGGVAEWSGTAGSSDGLRVPALAFPAGGLRMRAECQATESADLRFLWASRAQYRLKGTCHSAVSRCRQLLSPVPNESPKADPKVERNGAELTARSKPPVAVMDTELCIERTTCASDRSAT